MLWELFAFTGLVFWAWLIVTLGAIFLTVSSEKDAGAPVFWSILSALFVFGFTDFRVEPDAESVAWAVGAYAVGAVAFTCTRWFFLVRSMREFYDQIDVSYKAQGVSDESYRARQLASHFNADGYEIEVPPAPANFKSRITLWLLYWPFALPSWVLGDLLADLVHTAYERLAGTLGSIGRAGWGK